MHFTLPWCLVLVYLPSKFLCIPVLRQRHRPPHHLLAIKQRNRGVMYKETVADVTSKGTLQLDLYIEAAEVQ